MAWSSDGNTIAYVLAESMGSFPEYWIKDVHSQSSPRILLPATTYAINGLAWSPDGQQLLYVSSEGNGGGPDGTDNLWTISAKDGARTQLTHDMTIASWAWSPDGTWIAISATKHYEQDLFLYDIWLLRLDGEQLIRVTSAPPQDFGAYWSPDGTHLIFLREGVGLVTLSLETGEVTSLGIDPGFQYAIGGAK
jgi:Tol biopolymer transport system component